MSFDELMSIVLDKLAKALVETWYAAEIAKLVGICEAAAADGLSEFGAAYQRVSAEIYSCEYAPMEYARRKCRRENIREVFRPVRHKFSPAFSCSCSVPGMIRKKGRWVKRGVRV